MMRGTRRDKTHDIRAGHRYEVRGDRNFYDKGIRTNKSHIGTLVVAYILDNLEECVQVC